MIEKWRFINKIYDDIKNCLFFAICLVLIFFVVRWVIIAEYGSFEDWWNSGEAVVSDQ